MITSRASKPSVRESQLPRAERHEPVPHPRRGTDIEATSTGVGLPAAGPAVVRYVALGLLFQAYDQVWRAVAPIAPVMAITVAAPAAPAAPAARTIVWLGHRVARFSLVDRAGRHAATRLDHARERGIREVEDYRQRADAMVREVASAVMRSQAMEDTVGEVTRRFATPIVEAQLPVVIERLGERPEVLRPIVDVTVERFASRFMTPPSAD